ncbi:MAG: T9SS type A sorting domain-containing protein [Candidatus Woesearchaeota archaeon]
MGRIRNALTSTILAGTIAATGLVGLAGTASAIERQNLHVNPSMTQAQIQSTYNATIDWGTAAPDTVTWDIGTYDVGNLIVNKTVHTTMTNDGLNKVRISPSQYYSGGFISFTVLNTLNNSVVDGNGAVYDANWLEIKPFFHTEESTPTVKEMTIERYIGAAAGFGLKDTAGGLLTDLVIREFTGIAGVSAVGSSAGTITNSVIDPTGTNTTESSSPKGIYGLSSFEGPINAPSPDWLYHASQPFNPIRGDEFDATLRSPTDTTPYGVRKAVGSSFSVGDSTIVFGDNAFMSLGIMGVAAEGPDTRILSLSSSPTVIEGAYFPSLQNPTVSTLCPPDNTYQDPSYGGTIDFRYWYNTSGLADTSSACQTVGIPGVTPSYPRMVRASPNPMRNSGRIEFISDHVGTYNVNVFDVAGRQVWQYPSEITAGEQMISVPFDASNLSSGILLVRVSDAKTGVPYATGKLANLK